jgi:hypothetical protein
MPDRSSPTPNNISIDIEFTPRPEDEDSKMFGNANKMHQRFTKNKIFFLYAKSEIT